MFRAGAGGRSSLASARRRERQAAEYRPVKQSLGLQSVLSGIANTINQLERVSMNLYGENISKFSSVPSVAQTVNSTATAVRMQWAVLTLTLVCQ